MLAHTLITPPPVIDFGFYNGYISLAAASDLFTALQETWDDVNITTGTLTEEQLLYRYADGKWNIKEVLAHLVDAERNFCYRIMRLSRKDQAPLPMYDVHQFVANARAIEHPVADMLEELGLLRQATILMFRGMTAEMLDLTGPARDVTISVRALGFALAGHNTHHMNIVRERYLNGAR